MTVQAAVRDVLAELGFPTRLGLAAAAHDGAMVALVALVPSQADLDRLAVDGGEPPDQLHLTLLFLGKAVDYDDRARAAIVDRMRSLVEDVLRPDYDLPVVGDGFAVGVFNPGTDHTCVVLGVGGSDLDTICRVTADAVAEVQAGHAGFMVPEQLSPWVPHITLVYTDDDPAGLVGGLLDRVGPVAFDRMRVAFGGNVTDIPLAAPVNPLVLAVVRDELARLHLPGQHNQESHAGADGVGRILKKLRGLDGKTIHLTSEDGKTSIRIPFGDAADDADVEGAGRSPHFDEVSLDGDAAREFAAELEVLDDQRTDYLARVRRLLKAAEAINPDGGGDDDPDPASRAAWDAVGELAGDGQRIAGGELDVTGGTLVYEVRMGSDAGDVDGTYFLLALRPPEAPDDWDLHDEAADGPGLFMSHTQFKKLRKELNA